MEEIDRAIVALLSGDGRMSFTELAKRTGLSVSAVHQRVRRLEQTGVIKGYAALCSADEIGLPLTAFISIKPFDAAAPDDVPQRLEAIAAIEACHSVAGDAELHPQGAGGFPGGAGGPAAGDQGSRGGIHADDDRAEHPVREPAAGRPLTDAGTVRTARRPRRCPRPRPCRGPAARPG